MATNRRLVTTEGPDFYPTPAWGTKALMKYETFQDGIWEPCCGNGAISQVLYSKYEYVYSSDKFDRGYGNERSLDFLTTTKVPSGIKNIVTNPPFNIATDMILHALDILPKDPTNKVAFLLRTSFLESKDRYNKLFSVNPPNRVYIFSERLSMYPAGDDRKTGGTTSYAWFVWEVASKDNGQLHWIAPGMKER
jgi:hypothetical protein